MTFERLIRARQSGGPAEVDAALRLAGLVRPGQRLGVERLMDYLSPVSEPAWGRTVAGGLG